MLYPYFISRTTWSTLRATSSTPTLRCSMPTKCTSTLLVICSLSCTSRRLPCTSSGTEVRKIGHWLAYARIIRMRKISIIDISSTINMSYVYIWRKKNTIDVNMIGKNTLKKDFIQVIWHYFLNLYLQRLVCTSFWAKNMEEKSKVRFRIQNTNYGFDIKYRELYFAISCSSIFIDWILAGNGFLNELIISFVKLLHIHILRNQKPNHSRMSASFIIASCHLSHRSMR